MDLLPPDTTVGPVTLRVASLDRASAFYGELLGFHVERPAAGEAWLSAAGSEPLLRLVERSGVSHRSDGTPGLYHVAILYPDRRDLARTLLRMFERRVPFQGFADHGVSEAAYLADPDGNGIELAADRPRSEWERADGGVVMYTEVLNVTNMLRAVDGDPWIGPPAATRIGHVHLHVSDLVAAKTFYADTIGFNVTNADYPGAVFLAAGGYHHHLGINTWARGRRPTDDEVAGLDEFVIQVPDAAAREALSARLLASGAVIEEDALGFRTRDPDGNRIRVR